MIVPVVRVEDLLRDDLELRRCEFEGFLICERPDALNEAFVISLRVNKNSGNAVDMVIMSCFNRIQNFEQRAGGNWQYASSQRMKMR